MRKKVREVDQNLRIAAVHHSVEASHDSRNEGIIKRHVQQLRHEELGRVCAMVDSRFSVLYAAGTNQQRALTATHPYTFCVVNS